MFYPNDYDASLDKSRNSIVKKEKTKRKEGGRVGVSTGGYKQNYHCISKSVQMKYRKPVSHLNISKM